MKAEIADWCHEAKYAADLLEERGADPEVIFFLRNASRYAAAFKVAQALSTTPQTPSWLAYADEHLQWALDGRRLSHERMDAVIEVLRRLNVANAWLDVYRALTIQE